MNHKKRIRLRNFDYKGCYRYFITTCSHNKNTPFTNDILVNWLIDVLRIEAKHYGFKVWAWCFMPNHLHLLVEGEKPDSDMRRLISAYKQHTGFHYREKTGLTLWQTNYYEHVLRKEEDTMNIAHYIFNNPVRKGLVNDYRRHRFFGSFEFDCRAGL